MKIYYIYRTNQLAKNKAVIFFDKDALEMHIRIQLHRGIYVYFVEQSVYNIEGIPGGQNS